MGKIAQSIKFLLMPWLLKVVPPLNSAIARLRDGVVLKQAIRTTDDSLQTATVTYAHASGSREVVLIGMQHVADEEFFYRIAELLDEEEEAGSAILYEDVRCLTAEEAAGLSGKDAEVLRIFDGVFAAQLAMARSSGLAHQADALPPRASWINTDIPLSDLIGSFQPSDLTSVMVSSAVAPPAPDDLPNEPNPFSEFVVDFKFRNSHVLTLAAELMWLSPKTRRVRRIILDRRNEAAFSGIRRALATHDRVVTFWGVNHLPGIGRLLKRDGFSVTDVAWNTVYRFKCFS